MSISRICSGMWGTNFVYRPSPSVPLAVRDETVSPIPSRKRSRPVYLELVSFPNASLSSSTPSVIGSPMTKTLKVIVAGVRVSVMCPGQ